jgi:hypothetical protein
MLSLYQQEKKMNRIFNNYTTADYCPTTTTNSLVSRMNPTTAFEMPQDCFNIVKDYMGIVSVPTAVWNALLNQPLKHFYDIHPDYQFQFLTRKERQKELDLPACIASREKGLNYVKPFPKGTNLRKVSKKEKITRYIVGWIKYNIQQIDEINPLPNAEYLKKLRMEYILHTREQLHLYGEMWRGWGCEITDFSMYIWKQMINCELEYVYLRICKFDTPFYKKTEEREKEKQKNEFISWTKDLNVDDEVIVYRDYWRKGVVKKINQTSVSVQLYMFDEVDDDLYTSYNKLVWKGLGDEVVEIKHNKSSSAMTIIYKKGEKKYMDNYFNQSCRFAGKRYEN